MRIPRLAALWAVVAIVVGGVHRWRCLSVGKQRGQRRGHCLQGRRVVEQLRAAALGCH